MEKYEYWKSSNDILKEIRFIWYSIVTRMWKSANEARNLLVCMVLTTQNKPNIYLLTSSCESFCIVYKQKAHWSRYFPSAWFLYENIIFSSWINLIWTWRLKTFMTDTDTKWPTNKHTNREIKSFKTKCLRKEI